MGEESTLKYLMKGKMPRSWTNNIMSRFKNNPKVWREKDAAKERFEREFFSKCKPVTVSIDRSDKKGGRR